MAVMEVTDEGNTLCYTCNMAMLEAFVHPWCRSEPHALALAEEMQRECPCCHVQICPAPANRDRISVLDLFVLPAFVMNDRLLAVGVPGREWFVRRLREYFQAEMCLDLRPDTR